MSGAPDKSYPNRIFVEGADDFHVLCALVEKQGIRDGSDRRLPYAPPRVHGYEMALKEARTAVKALTPRVGLVVDADTNPDTRWSEIRNALDGISGMVLPNEYTPRGVIVAGDMDARLGIWLMPGDRAPGAIESFLRSLVPQNDLWHHAEQSTMEARQKGAEFGDKDLDKARLRAWLAWQKVPGAPYGRAIQEHYFSPSSPQADALVAWFRALFNFA